MGVSALELRRRVLMAQPHKERKTGGIVSFKTHVPQVLDVSVPLSPVQAGTGDPYPPGGGINLVDVQDVSGIKSQTQIKAGISLPAGTYTISAYIANSGTAGAALRVINGSSSLKTIGYSYTPTPTRFSGQFTLESATEDLKLSVVGNASGYDASVSQVQIEKGSTAHDFAPYSNIRPISGHTGATVCRTGKNLLDLSWFASQTVNGVTFTKDDGQISISGTATGTINLNGQYFLLPPGTYTLSGSISNNQLYIYDASTNTVLVESVNGNVRTVTTTEQKTVYLRIRVGNGATVSGIAKPMLEPGATASEYAPFSGESFPFTFPDTVYGGRLEPAAGVLKVETAIVDLGSVNWGLNTAGNQEFMFSNGIRDFVKRPPASSVTVNIICSNLATVSAYSIYTGTSKQGVGIHIDGSIRAVYPNMPTDGTQFRQAVTGWKLVYELAEPLIVPLTPAEIRALMGENNVFADTGDVDVEFWTN